MTRCLSILLAISLLVISSNCGKDTSQIGGIIGEVKFITQACVPHQKIINIRNDDTQNPQRVMGVYFENGTNKDSLYILDKVVVGGTEYSPEEVANRTGPDAVVSREGGMALDVLIPAGGIMSNYVTYKPRKITNNNLNTSYLDLFLNGPKLGILQIRMSGEAPTAAEGCGQGQSFIFNVTKASMQISKPGSQFDGFDEEIQVEGQFKILVAGNGLATLEKSGFPKLNFISDALRSVLPNNSNTLPIELQGGTFEGTFADNKLSFDNLKLTALLPINGVKLRSEALNVEGDNGASLSLQGSSLTPSADMKVVLGVKVAGFHQALDGAAIGVTLELKKQN